MADPDDNSWRKTTFSDSGGEDGPVVGRTRRGLNLYLVIGGFVLLAIMLFLFLNSRRTEQASLVAAGDNGAAGAPLPPPPPLEIPVRAPAPAPAAPIPPPAPPVAAPPAAPAASNEQTQRLHAPAVVVDLQSQTGTAVPVAASVPASGAPSAALAGKSEPSALSLPIAPAAGAGDLAAASAGAMAVGGLGSNDQFAARVSNLAPPTAVATQLRDLTTVITQGAIIPAVLEGALDSDLPGYTRAVVSRDVRGFDGKAVLIPRGSRLIGQYRSAMSLTQERVFIIWTRVIRPDGVTIQIGSPGDDALGRGGLGGEVSTHFFARYGSSILLSLLNGGIAAVAGTPTTQISIGSPAAAAGAAATAVVPGGGTDIMPTIKVKQGATISIFVARDLDFSAVKAFP